MSNLSSGGSSGTSIGRSHGRIIGVPKNCWCGESIVELIAKTSKNPYRRFYRCRFAAAEKLENDNHAFKWVDEALVNEIELVDTKAKRIAKEVSDMKRFMNDTIEYEKTMFEKMELEVEERLNEKMEGALTDAKWSMWKTMFVVVVVGFTVIIGCTKFVD